MLGDAPNLETYGYTALSVVEGIAYQQGAINHRHVLVTWATEKHRTESSGDWAPAVFLNASNKTCGAVRTAAWLFVKTALDARICQVLDEKQTVSSR